MCCTLGVFLSHRCDITCGFLDFPQKITKIGYFGFNYSGYFFVERSHSHFLTLIIIINIIIVVSSPLYCLSVHSTRRLTVERSSCPLPYIHGATIVAHSSEDVPAIRQFSSLPTLTRSSLSPLSPPRVERLTRCTCRSSVMCSRVVGTSRDSAARAHART